MSHIFIILILVVIAMSTAVNENHQIKFEEVLDRNDFDAHMEQLIIGVIDSSSLRPVSLVLFVGVMLIWADDEIN